MSSTPTASRQGDLVLQPNYFSSSAYVDPLREDITALIEAYINLYSSSDSKQPFVLFKDLWLTQGWGWLHFKATEGRARQVFLSVTVRLFLERTAQPEPLLTQVAGLYGLYIFFYTQPSGAIPPLHCIKNIPIPLDQLVSLKALPENLTGPELLPLKSTTAYILSRLLNDGVFCLLPDSAFGVMNPRRLPHEIVVANSASSADGAPVSPRKGRPSKRSRARRAKAAYTSLERWLEHGAPSSTMAETTTETGRSSMPPTSSLHQYHVQKSQLLDVMANSEGSFGALHQASQFVLDRLKAVQDEVSDTSMELGPTSRHVGLERVEKVVRDMNKDDEKQGGLLRLLEPDL